MHPLLFVWRYNQDKKVAYFALKRDPGPIYSTFWVEFYRGEGRGGGDGAWKEAIRGCVTEK